MSDVRSDRLDRPTRCRGACSRPIVARDARASTCTLPLAALLVTITANLAMVLQSSPGAVGVSEAAKGYELGE